MPETHADSSGEVVDVLALLKSVGLSESQYYCACTYMYVALLLTKVFHSDKLSGALGAAKSVYSAFSGSWHCTSDTALYSMCDV